MKSSLLDAFDDIYEVWERAWWQRPSVIALFIGITIFLLSLIYGLRYVRKKYFSKRATKSEILLQELATAVLTEDNEIHIYDIMIHIMKEIIEQRWNKCVLHFSDKEVLALLEEIDQTTFVTLKPIIERSYSIRFAAEKYPLEDVRADIMLFSHTITKLSQPAIHEPRF